MQLTTFHRFLAAAVQNQSSDIHLYADSMPMVRINGAIKEVKAPRLTAEDTRLIVSHVLATVPQPPAADQLTDMDTSYEVPGVGRFRVAILRTKGCFGVVLRTIKRDMPALSEIGLPPVLEKIASAERGLILVTGATGSGKTTTLAAMVDHINRTKRKHILTIEDPIEYFHSNKLSQVTQREIGLDTPSFSKALRHALRQDPDVILVGEIRDEETVDVALKAAETGHLVLSTLHTNNAVQTIDRIIDVFPAAQQNQVRIQLASSLAGIFSQRLIPRIAGGLIPAYELLLNNTAVANLIREERTHEIQTMIETGAAEGMIDMNRCLAELVRAGEITVESAYSRSISPKTLERLL